MGDQYGLDHSDLVEDSRLKVVVREESSVVDLATLSPAAGGKVQMSCSNDDLHRRVLLLEDSVIPLEHFIALH